MVIIKVKNTVRKLLDEKGLHQHQLADLTGISRPTISMICRNAGESIRYDHLAKLAVALDVKNIGDLFEVEVADDTKSFR